jgi:hypothetical protein
MHRYPFNWSLCTFLQLCWDIYGMTTVLLTDLWTLSAKNDAAMPTKVQVLLDSFIARAKWRFNYKNNFTQPHNNHKCYINPLHFHSLVSAKVVLRLWKQISAAFPRLAYLTNAPVTVHFVLHSFVFRISRGSNLNFKTGYVQYGIVFFVTTDNSERQIPSRSFQN